MTRIAPLLVAALLAQPVLAETPGQGRAPAPPAPTDEGFSLIEEGAKLILREMFDNMAPAMEEARDGLGAAMKEWGPALSDLVAKVGDLSAYHAPEVLPNGDILIRKKRPRDTPLVPGPDGEIEL
jgi:hypothetical protein